MIVPNAGRSPLAIEPKLEEFQRAKQATPQTQPADGAGLGLNDFVVALVYPDPAFQFVDDAIDQTFVGKIRRFRPEREGDGRSTPNEFTTLELEFETGGPSSFNTSSMRSSRKAVRPAV